MTEPLPGPDTQPVEALAKRLFLAAQRAARVALFFIIPLTAALFVYLAYKQQVGAVASPWAVAAASFSSAVLTNVIPVLVVVAFIKPLADAITRARDREADLSRTQTLAAAVRDLARPDIIETRESLARIERRLDARIPVREFYSSFEDVRWDRLLKGAKSLELAAFYWSPEWMDRNLPHLKRAIETGTAVSLFVANPYRQESSFYKNAELNSKSTSRILQMIGRYLRMKVPGQQRRLFVSRSGINYMAARIHYADRTAFAFSIYRTSNAATEGRPPLVVLDEDRADPDLLHFIEQEFKELFKAPEIPDLDLNQYLQWSEDGTRVVVSFSLSCPMPCAFCYVESVREGDAVEVWDRTLLGGILASAVVNDERFDRERTVVFLGGMSDPLLGKNLESAIAFLKALRSEDHRNRVHVATRAKVEDENLIDFLASDKRTVLAFSVPVLSDGVEASEAEIRKRLASAGLLHRRGVNVSAYVRPVIPGRTLADAPAVADLAAELGLKNVVVGGLYVDENISDRLTRKGIHLPTETGASKLIMDRRGSLRKLVSQEVDEVGEIFRSRGFTVYESAFELASEVVS
jgi:DNA repair photolyase